MKGGFVVRRRRTIWGYYSPFSEGLPISEAPALVSLNLLGNFEQYRIPVGFWVCRPWSHEAKQASPNQGGSKL
jgi:hypothetical protein